MKICLGHFGDICRMIKIEHSIFALPYAWAGAFLAARGVPSARVLLFLTLAMIGVRSFAMTFNRLADLEIDALNPRTRNRPLITGAITTRQAQVFCLLSIAVFLVSCWFLNLTCFILAFPAIAFAGAYSYLKRFSPLCHFWLGATLGLAPLAGWLAVRSSELGLAPIMLFFAITFWVGAFDIYYAFQDLEFDKTHSVHSIPADFGPHTALALAGFAHVMTMIFLCLTGLCARLSWPWYVLCAGIAVVLFWEHKLMEPEDLRHINTAFFTLNAIISPLVLLGIIIGLYPWSF